MQLSSVDLSLTVQEEATFQPRHTAVSLYGNAARLLWLESDSQKT